MDADWKHDAYRIIGRTDGVYGEPGEVNLPEDLSAAICARFHWHRFTGRAVRLYRGAQLEVQGEGRWLEGWARVSLYELLGMSPWSAGSVPEVSPAGSTQTRKESQNAE